jgi:hypothetical protein
MPANIELHYLPNITYFSSLLKYGEIWIEAHEYYQKQSYRNRCQILTSNGKIDLTVPIVHTGNKVLIRDVQIDYSQNWTEKHWRTFVTAYSKSPFFEYFAPYFESIYKKKSIFLFDLNLEILTVCLKLLRISPTIHLTESYDIVVPDRHIDIRNEIHPKKQPDLGYFYRPVAYRQNFGNEFVANLSVIDLLMCKGVQAKQIIEQSINEF